MEIKQIVWIKDAVKQIHQANREKGFWDHDRNVGELLMLVVSELGEAIEAHRKNKKAHIEAFRESLEGLPADVVEKSFRLYMKDSFEDEIADAVIRLFDMAGGLGIDLESHINAKLAYNATRERLHGKAY